MFIDTSRSNVSARVLEVRAPKQFQQIRFLMGKKKLFLSSLSLSLLTDFIPKYGPGCTITPDQD